MNYASKFKIKPKGKNGATKSVDWLSLQCHRNWLRLNSIVAPTGWHGTAKAELLSVVESVSDCNQPAGDKWSLLCRKYQARK
ncbi:hypothetical protein [Rheinheimera sp.]|uniref:hypothetical protein n=1 Tax=Rheinheimera sp. TaxID=1869214 RepID=UPI00307EFA41